MQTGTNNTSPLSEVTQQVSPIIEDITQEAERSESAMDTSKHRSRKRAAPEETLSADAGLPSASATPIAPMGPLAELRGNASDQSGDLVVQAQASDL